MDWKKAKSILIIMFLIINAFLSYQLITINRNQYNYIDQDEIQNVTEHLLKKNIQLDTEIPDRVMIAPSIRVKYNEFKSKQIAGMFFESGYKISGTNDNYVINDENVTIEVRNRFNLIYTNKAIIIRQQDIDEDRCLNNAYSFVSKLKLSSNNRYVKLKQVERGYVRLILGQKYNNIPVESSQIEILATEDGVAQAKVNWFEWIKTDRKYNITTPVVALLKAYENRGANHDTVIIKDIRQGYYFGVDTSKGEEDVTLEGTASPMWVIQSNKDEIYINAYNENIEQIR